jgi:hypothetical protein
LSFVYFFSSLSPSCNIACYFYSSFLYIIFHFSLSEILSSHLSLDLFILRFLTLFFISHFPNSSLLIYL